MHGLIHAHRKSRVIGVRMAMCTSKPIIGKDATGGCRLTKLLYTEGKAEDIASLHTVRYDSIPETPVLGKLEQKIESIPFFHLLLIS